MTSATNSSVTEQVADWIVQGRLRRHPDDRDRAPEKCRARLPRQPVRGDVGLDRPPPLGVGPSSGRRPVMHGHRSRLQDDAVARNTGQRCGSHRSRTTTSPGSAATPTAPSPRPARAGGEARRLRPRLRARVVDRLGDHGADDAAVVRPATSSSTGAGSTRASRRRSASPRWPPGCSSWTSARPAWRSATPRPPWPG